MKKYLMGILAIVMAIGLGAFTKEETTKSNNENAVVKYFRIVNHDYNPGVAVLSEDAEYLGETDPGSSGCSGSNKQCISIFDPSQVNANNELKDDLQVPQSYPYKKL